jgi:hypothetical protein
MFDPVYTEKHKHLYHEISITKFTMKNNFIIYLASYISILIFLYKVGQTFT